MLKKKFGVRAQILAGFACFAAIIIALLWVFQITLLNSFYRLIKENEVKRTSEYVVSHIDDTDLVDTLSQVVRNTDIDIMITNEYGENIINVSNIKSTLFERLTVLQCAKIYAQVSAENGEQMVRYSNNSEGNPPSQGKNGKDDFGESIVYIKLTTTADGSSRMVILNTVITPVTSTVDTLKVQLWCLTAVMLVLSFIIAMIISRKISKPIEAINASAKELAHGDYTINFAENGSKEIVELAKTLNYAGEELSKVENLRRELIANVSHDLRTPLTMITGYSEVMRDIPGENTPENVQIIIDEATRLTGLVNDMLDISKLESGNMKIVPQSFDLTQSIEDILTRYDKLADYQFNFYHGAHIYVYADELKISQVVYNLVNNAITYTGDDKSINVTQTLDNDMVMVEVTDTGEGIPQDKLKDIWERYYKVDKQHKRAAVGTGLGLSIVRKILELHGGEYGVRSSEGHGSTFWFKLKIQSKKDVPELPEENEAQ